MEIVWSGIGVAAALTWGIVLRFSDSHADQRLWPPVRGTLVTAVWAWGLTILIYLGTIQAGFGADQGLGLPGWVRWGLGGLLSVAGTALHTWGTLALGLAGTSGWPVPLVTEGIYGRTRHPQYLGQAIMLVGLALLAGSGWSIWPAVAGAAALLYAAQVEDRHLAAIAPGHDAYRARTPFLL